MSRTTAGMDDGPRDETRKPTFWRCVPLAAVLLGVAVGYALGWQDYLTLGFLAESRETLKAVVAGNYAASLAAFFVLYALAIALSFPAASILTIFGGFLFGWAVAAPVVAVAATLGATALFLIARTALGDVLRRRIGGKAAGLAEGFEQNAFGYLLVLRLAPVVPFFVLNIAPALFRVPLKSYVAATFLGILPGTLVYSLLGEGVGSVIAAAQAAGREPTVGDLVTPQITLAFAGLALVAALALIVRRLRERASG